MKTIILGGTFNPVHNGHLFLAEELRCLLGYDHVLFIPSYVPAHKHVESDVGASHRVRMLELALQRHGYASVDTLEIERGGVSYTVDTIRQLIRQERIQGKPGLVIGDDLGRSFHTWKEASTVVELCDIVIAHRDSREELEFPYPHRYIDNLMLPISSTEVRERIIRGLPVRHLVPESVFFYIEQQGLYAR
jgi:nicotinate-nucleotide adenylyltransferase